MKRRGFHILLIPVFTYFAIIPNNSWLTPKTQDNDKISLSLRETPLRAALQLISQQTKTDLVYSDELVSGIVVSCNFADLPLHAALAKILHKTPISFTKTSETQVVLFTKSNPQELENLPAATIRGRVLDKETDAPLEAVNVFLANTLMGDATNAEGDFVIKGVPRGQFELVVSRIGYGIAKKKLDLGASLKKDFTFRLAPKPYQTPAIAVSAEHMKEWQKDLKRFTKLFLGSSINAKACTILNPEVLDFSKDDRNRRFEAIVSAPLQIESSELGYQVEFILEEFSHVKDDLNYVGSARFKELTPRDKKEAQKWRRNRIKAYTGSLRHFLRVAFNQRTEAEGFLVYRTPGLPQENWTSPREKVSARRLLYYTRSPLDPAFELERELRFEDYLEVAFVTELEEESYIEYRINSSIEARRTTDVEPREQRSWIAMNRTEVLVDKLGRVNHPRALKTYGYWAWERFAEMLPLEYSPSATDKARSPKLAKAPNRSIVPDKPPVVEDWEKKLAGLLADNVTLEQRGQWDPRIGIAFIELATGHKAEKYYEQASELYYWGFSPNLFRRPKKEVSEKMVKAVEDEVSRIIPLLKEDEVELWKAGLARWSPDLAIKIRTFWLERDPTPTTALNERLIEHWKRIAYARKNFTRTKNTSYGTDDRGLIYVKFGKPDKQKVLTLGGRASEIYNVASTFGIRANRYGDFRTGVEAFLNYPECVAWSYRFPHDKQPLLFLFGRDEGNGSFGLRESVEEFIPRRAFGKSSSRYTMGITPGAVVQMLYYSTLFNFDMYFAERMNELDSRMNDFANYRLVRSLSSKFEMEDANTNYRARRRAPADRSELAAVQITQLGATRARLLDPNNRPVMIICAFAGENAFDKANGERRKRTKEEIEESESEFTLLIRDRDMEEIARFSATPLSATDKTVAFSISHSEEQFHYTIGIETRLAARDHSGQSVRQVRTGKESFPKIELLDPNPDKLEVSDLLIGVESPRGLDRSQLPLPVIPTTRIWKPDPLQIYLEIYHLKIDSRGAGQFNLDSRITKIKAKGDKVSREELVATSFDFTSSGSVAREKFGLSMDQLPVGAYELEIEVTDLVSGQKKSRRAAFRIMGQEK